MQNNNAGKSTVRQIARPVPPLATIADALNDTDAALEALVELLEQARAPVSPDGLVRLLRPHLRALRRAAEDLNQHA